MITNIQEAMNILYRVNRKLFTANAGTNEFLIGAGQIKVLREIIEHDRISQEELANILNLDKTTVAKSVKKLETLKLIERNKSKTDQRKKELVATEKALLVKNKMIKHVEEKSKALFNGISVEDIDIFKDVLIKIEKNIESNRRYINERKQIGMKVIKFLEQNDNVTVDKLAEALDKDLGTTNKIIEKLVIKECIHENNGFLYTNKNVIREKKH